jgi:hypothetical protein
METKDYLIIAGINFIIMLFLILLIALMSSGNAEQKSILLVWNDSQMPEQMLEFKCDDVGFAVNQFSLTGKTGTATINKAKCYVRRWDNEQILDNNS